MASSPTVPGPGPADSPAAPSLSRVMKASAISKSAALHTMVSAASAISMSMPTVPVKAAPSRSTSNSIR